MLLVKMKLDWVGQALNSRAGFEWRDGQVEALRYIQSDVAAGQGATTTTRNGGVKKDSFLEPLWDNTL